MLPALPETQRCSGESTEFSMTSSRPSTSAAEPAADPRCVLVLPRGKFAARQEHAKEIALSLLCLFLGPLIYAASLATVATMLVMTCAALIVSRRDNASILVKCILTLGHFGPLLVWMLVSAAWSLDG